MALTREEKINILTAQDIIGIKKDMEFEDYSIIYDLIVGGDGWKQYNDYSDDEINNEFRDRFDDILDCAETMALAHKLNEEPIDLLRL